jgi:hypothetical protein
MDYTPYLQGIEAVVFGILVPTIPLGLAYAKRHLDFIKDAKVKEIVGDAIDDVNVVADQAAQSAYSMLQAKNGDINTAIGKSAVADHIASFIATVGSKAVATSGLTPDQLTKIGIAAFGKLLASDPTVNISPSTQPKPELVQGAPLLLGSTDTQPGTLTPAGQSVISLAAGAASAGAATPVPLEAPQPEIAGH